MKRKVMTILCFITGFLLCSYPLVSNRIEQERQQKVITTYENGLEKTKDMESVWREAQKYNEMLQQIHGKIVAGMMEKTLREEHYGNTFECVEDRSDGSYCNTKKSV